MTEKMNEQHEDEATAADVVNGDTAEGADVERLQQELKETKDRLLRTAADFENFRQRTRRELEEQRQYAALPVIRDLLPVTDNLCRAVESAEQTAEFENLVQGVRMVLTQFQRVLSEHGVSEIEDVGESFDPHVHEATAQQPSDEHATGTVAQVVQRGYRLHDRVVRPAKVVVSSGSLAGE